MMETLQMYQCLLCQEEKNIWAIINYSPTWRKAFSFLENEHICRACANIEGNLGRIFSRKLSSDNDMNTLFIFFLIILHVISGKD